MRLRRLLIPFIFILSLLALAACNGSDTPYVETFDSEGSWRTGSDTYTEGSIHDGVYDLFIIGDDISRWATPGRDFKDGIYEVEATQVEGPLDNGFGLIFRADTGNGDFYLFKVSGDGYVWIGRYVGEVEDQSIIGGHWFESTAVNTGLNQTNKLRVVAESGNLIFFVNDKEVGRVTDNKFESGDVGLFAQSLGFGGVRVYFDNLSVTPLEK
ncbi:MAG: hypothetical protein ACK2UP_03535 [Candidatus Promineifilaceae bacterium]